MFRFSKCCLFVTPSIVLSTKHFPENFCSLPFPSPSILTLPPPQTANPRVPNLALRSPRPCLGGFQGSSSLSRTSPVICLQAPPHAPSAPAPPPYPTHPPSLPLTRIARLRDSSKKWPKGGKSYELHSGAKGQDERGEGSRDQEQCRGHGKKWRGGERGGFGIPAAAGSAPAPPPAWDPARGGGAPARLRRVSGRCAQLAHTQLRSSSLGFLSPAGGPRVTEGSVRIPSEG